jgi:serine/threonine protein kinase
MADYLELASVVRRMFEGQRVFNNQYQVEEFYGRLGGQSLIFTATNVETHEKLILKIIDPKISEECIDHELAMTREMDRLGSILLVQCYWTEKITIPVWGKNRQSGAIVMPKLSDEDIWERLDRRSDRYYGIPGRMEEAEIRVLGRDMVESLILLHLHGFAHNDVKPENFLLRQHDGKERVALCDYGMVQKVENGFVRKGVLSHVGTGPYRAPELLENPNEWTTAVDLWALGCTFFYMFTGQLAFPNGKPQEDAIKHGAFNQIIRNFEISDAFLDLLFRLICVTPAGRLTAENVAHHHFFGVIQDTKERVRLIVPDDSNYRPTPI